MLFRGYQLLLRFLRNFGLDPDLLEAQIKINTKSMEEIEALKEERMRMAAAHEKIFKERWMLATKLGKAYEQLVYLKKKVDKRGDSDDGPNKGPNEAGPPNNGHGKANNDDGKENRSPSAAGPSNSNQ